MNEVETNPRSEEICAMDLPVGGVGRVTYSMTGSRDGGDVVMRTYTGLVSLVDGMTWAEVKHTMKVIPVRTATIKIPWLN